jgi:hypothetical protein
MFHNIVSSVWRMAGFCGAGPRFVAKGVCGATVNSVKGQLSYKGAQNLFTFEHWSTPESPAICVENIQIAS